MLNLISRKRGIVGVDIGARCVKVAQLAARSGQLQLQRAIILDRQAAKTDTVGEPFCLTDLQDLLRACEVFSGRDVAAVLSMAACEVKSEKVEPNLPSRQLMSRAREMALRDSCLPTPLQQDFWTSNTGPNQRALHVLSTSRQTTTTLMKSHRAAGWTCVALDGLPTALSRAARLGGYAEETPVVAIDWGWSRVTLCIVFRGESLFVRSFHRGALGTIVNSICKDLRLRRQEARELLTTVGVAASGERTSASRTASAVARCSRAAFGELELEVARTLDFVQARHRDIAPQQIVLFGGGATISGVTHWFTTTFDRPCEVWNYPHIAGGNVDSPPCTPLLGPAIALSALAWERS